jgi:hypothetical protein
MNYDGITLNLVGSRGRFYKHKMHDHIAHIKFTSLYAIHVYLKHRISHIGLPYTTKVKNDISLNSSIMTLCNDGIIDRRVISLRAFRRRRRKYGHFELADS